MFAEVMVVVKDSVHVFGLDQVMSRTNTRYARNAEEAEI